jgi:DNA-binding MarR family transcriptional regulator
MVSRLEDAGLIERVADPGDRRVRLLQLSPHGSRRLRDACGDEVERRLAEQPEDDLRILVRLLGAVTPADAGAPEGDHVPPAVTRDWSRWS